MFGAFKPSAALSGGLLWKIPWRLSRPRKMRHRQRLRRVDNVVSVLDSALKRQSIASLTTSPSASSSPSSPSGDATPNELAQTAEGLRMLYGQNQHERSKTNEDRRHGKGPKRGDYVPETNPVGIQVQGKKLLRDLVDANGTTKLIERWKAEMPSEQDMLPRDKYTMFDKKVRGYRKGVHKLPKWTRMSQRLNPPGF